ncbi:MAG: pyridoxine 5'-phosphate oxidase C-terminal domain-containing protein [Persicimonas sp.]
MPFRFEFWEAEAYRLHDRFEFVREEKEGEWKVQKLYP